MVISEENWLQINALQENNIIFGIRKLVSSRFRELSIAIRQGRRDGLAGDCARLLRGPNCIMIALQ